MHFPELIIWFLSEESLELRTEDLLTEPAGDLVIVFNVMKNIEKYVY